MLQKIRNQEPFKSSTGHFYGELLEPELYVVYSYGKSWPIAAYIQGRWFLNADRISAATSKHTKAVQGAIPNPTTVTLEELQARIKRFQEN